MLDDSGQPVFPNFMAWSTNGTVAIGRRNTLLAIVRQMQKDKDAVSMSYPQASLLGLDPKKAEIVNDAALFHVCSDVYIVVAPMYDYEKKEPTKAGDQMTIGDDLL